MKLSAFVLSLASLCIPDVVIAQTTNTTPEPDQANPPSADCSDLAGPAQADCNALRNAPKPGDNTGMTNGRSFLNPNAINNSLEGSDDR
jgi:hypothetical protein